MRLRLFRLAIFACLMVGVFAAGWYSHRQAYPPQPQWVKDTYPGDVDFLKLMEEGKLHAHFECPKGYVLVAPEGAEPECK